MLKRSLASLKTLIEQMVDEVRGEVAPEVANEPFSLARFIADAEQGAELDAKERSCTFTVSPLDPDLVIAGDRDRLLAALANLLLNAFKYTHPHTDVSLKAYAAGDRVLIEVRDHCGGLAPGTAERMFSPSPGRHAHASA